MAHIFMPPSQPRRQRGSVILLFASLLPVLLGFTALAVDISRIQLAKQELQMRPMPRHWPGRPL